MRRGLAHEKFPGAEFDPPVGLGVLERCSLLSAPVRVTDADAARVSEPQTPPPDVPSLSATDSIKLIGTDTCTVSVSESTSTRSTSPHFETITWSVRSL